MDDKLKELHDFLGEMQSRLQKISDDINRKPREFWIEITYNRNNSILVHTSKPRWIAIGSELIKVREVIE